MSLQTQTTKEIDEQFIAQVETVYGQTVPIYKKAFFRVISKIFSGIFILLYKYGGFIFQQMFVSTASSKETEVNGVTIVPLNELGKLSGLGLPASATVAELLVNVTVENQTGFLPAYSQLVNTSNGVTYITLGDALLNAATIQVIVRAASDQAGTGGRGVIGNLDAGSILSFANPLPNVARNATVVSQVVTGANAEDVEVYRQRIIDYFQARPQGGAYSDYRIWATETEGILNAYPYTSALPGQVDVYCEATVLSSGSSDGIPTIAQITEVLNNINLDENGLARRRPATAWVNVFPIVRTGFDVDVSGITGVGNLSQVREDIEAALTSYFLSVYPFISGLDIPPRFDKITNTRISAIVEDIVSAQGGTFSTVTLSVSGGSVVDFYTLSEGEKAKLTDITFL